jgi:DNA-binding transcriptional MerR regulator/GGDEF domain-containing protein
MNEPNIERIRKHLQNVEVQERIQRRMLDARSKATVTISRAASLFNFSESQLREWEKRGLLKTDRPALTPDSKTSTGHRQYSPEELDKLALIRELMDEDYGVSEIPQNIDTIWKQILDEQQKRAPYPKSQEFRYIQETEHLPIDERIEYAGQEAFWRYFVSQILRLSLLLICEDIPDTIAGLVLPLQKDEKNTLIRDPKDLNKSGLSLVGWLGWNRAFYCFLDAAPSFEFPSDFRLEPLKAVKVGHTQYTPLFIVQRKAWLLPQSDTLRETIQRLLELVYRYTEKWQPCFDYGMRDWTYQVTDFTIGQNVTDEVLNGLTGMVVALGGKTPDGRDRWRFCTLYLPDEPLRPLQQRNLFVRARSKQAPIPNSSMYLSARNPGLTFRAYQSGHVIYRPRIASQDFILAYREHEETTRSAIAIPIMGEDGLAIASLYIASDQADAFSMADQRALRLITRMIEELLVTYQARRQVVGKLRNLITNPGLVDVSFREFMSEDEFIDDLGSLLSEIHNRDMTEQDISFIAVDIDNQSSLATKYGDQVARNLSRAVGLRIQNQLGLFSSLKSSRLYHVRADSFYLMLGGISLEEARSKAALLLQALSGDYRIDARRVTTGRPMTPDNMLELHNVTVRLGVPSYKFSKLKEVLLRNSAETAVAAARSVIMNNLDQSLQIGQQEGGNIIISWDPISLGFKPWKPAN